jgi:hypothetical protein
VTTDQGQERAAEEAFGRALAGKLRGRTVSEDRSGRFRDGSGRFVPSPLDTARQEGRDPTEDEQRQAAQLAEWAALQEPAEEAARRAGFADPADLWVLGDRRLIESDPDAAAADLAARRPYLLDPAAQFSARLRAMAGLEPVAEPESPAATSGSGDGGARPVLERPPDPDQAFADAVMTSLRHGGTF